MSACTDCRGNTPTSAWLRCVECAMARLRFMMSGGRVTQSPRARRRTKGDRVTVLVAGEQLPGVVVRERDDRYTVDLGGGRRCYVGAGALRDVVDSRC